MDKFEILITSPPDRERLVAEIWYSELNYNFHTPLVTVENEKSIAFERVLNNSKFA